MRNPPRRSISSRSHSPGMPEASSRPRRERRVCVGKIGGPHGIRGEVKLWSYTAEPLAVKHYGPLESADGARTFEIEALRPAQNFLIARIKGVADRSAAEKLRNIELYVSRARLPEIQEADEFYRADLIGLIAVDREARPLGTIVAIQNFGAGDLLEIELGQDRDTVLIPFTEVTVPQVDIAGGRMVVDLPESDRRGQRDAGKLPPSVRGKSTAKRSGGR